MKHLSRVPAIARLGWFALTMAAYVLFLGGLWRSLNLNPALMTAMVAKTSQGQAEVVVFIAAAVLTTCWFIAGRVVGSLAALVHSGRHLLLEVPLVVTLLKFAAVILVVSSPYTGALVYSLGFGLIAHLFGNWLDTDTDRVKVQYCPPPLGTAVMVRPEETSTGKR